MVMLEDNMQDTDVMRFWCTYYPYQRGMNPKFDSNSRLLLDLKDDKLNAVNFFYDKLVRAVKKDIAVAVVPSHDPNKVGGGVYSIANKMVSAGRFDAINCLNRHKIIQKLAHGGDRDIKVHLNSIEVLHHSLIVDKKVLLLDDIMTTGNSLNACKQLLLKAGAKEVQCLAFGKTEGY